jgi:hypothetical protein
MKFKTNIPALMMALLVFVATTGISAFEHICNSTQSRSLSFFLNTSSCEMDKVPPPCCAKLGIKKKGCCEQKQFFSKLSYEGFTAKQLELKKVEKVFESHPGFIAFSSFHKINLENYFRGLPPPDNLFDIKSSLQPFPSDLQNFRC